MLLAISKETHMNDPGGPPLSHKTMVQSITFPFKWLPSNGQTSLPARPDSQLIKTENAKPFTSYCQTLHMEKPHLQRGHTRPCNTIVILENLFNAVKHFICLLRG